MASQEKQPAELQCQYCGDAVTDLEDHRQDCRNAESWDSVRPDLLTTMHEELEHPKRAPSIGEKLARLGQQFQEHQQETQKKQQEHEQKQQEFERKIQQAFDKKVKHLEMQVNKSFVKKKNIFIMNSLGVLVLALVLGLAINVMVYKPLESMIAKQIDELAISNSRLEALISEQNKKLALSIDSQRDEIKTKISEQNNEIESQLEVIKTELCGDIPCIPPHHITLNRYKQLLQEKKYSPSYIYTHLRGYKIILMIWPSGWGQGESSHLSVRIHSRRGKYDSELHFPAQITVTVELVNQYNDKNHWVRDIECAIASGKINLIGAAELFITNSELYWNPSKETQYLMNDSLKFRVTKIVREELLPLPE